MQNKACCSEIPAKANNPLLVKQDTEQPTLTLQATEQTSSLDVTITVKMCGKSVKLSLVIGTLDPCQHCRLLFSDLVHCWLTVMQVVCIVIASSCLWSP